MNGNGSQPAGLRIDDAMTVAGAVDGTAVVVDVLMTSPEGDATLRMRVTPRQLQLMSSASLLLAHELQSFQAIADQLAANGVEAVAVADYLQRQLSAINAALSWPD